MTVLKGPADADSYRVKQGRYGTRFYTDPLPGCDIAPASEWVGPSISATKPPFANKYVPMQAIAAMPDTEWVRLSNIAVTDRYEAIKTHDKATSRVNMSRGSLIHEWAEDLLFGRPMRFPLGYDQQVVDQASTFQSALQAFFDTHQPDLVAAEVVCLNRTLNGVGYGGTADAFARIDGDLWIIDWKSRNSDHAAYLEEAAQGGGYAGAEYMIVTGPDGNPARMAIPDVAGVLIVSIRSDGFKAYPIDRDGAVKAYEAMHRWWVSQRAFTDDKVIGRPWAPKVAAGGSGSTTSATVTPTDPPADEFVVTAGDGRRPTVTITYTRTGLRARAGALIEAGHEDALRTAWPSGVPPLSKDGHSVEELTAILHAIMRVEGETSTTFPVEDVTVLRAPPVELPATLQRVELDEGGPINDTARRALEHEFNSLTADAKAVVAQITKDASEAGRSISVSAHPTMRRWSIARAVIKAAAQGTDMWTLTTEIATAEQLNDSNLTLGAILGTFTISQANQLADALDTSVAA
jgi:hypothetical protein